MNDIYGVKYFDIYEINYYFLILFFLIVFFYIYLEKRKKIKNNIIQKINHCRSSNLSYEKIDHLFREYFEYIGIKNSFLKTLKELKVDFLNNKIDTNIIKLFEENYNLQFSSKNNSKIKLSNILSRLQKIIKK